MGLGVAGSIPSTVCIPMDSGRSGLKEFLSEGLCEVGSRVFCVLRDLRTSAVLKLVSSEELEIIAESCRSTAGLSGT